MIEQINIHIGQVTTMCISPDGNFLFTTGIDGSIFIIKISEQFFTYKDKSMKAIQG